MNEPQQITNLDTCKSKKTQILYDEKAHDIDLKSYNFLTFSFCGAAAKWSSCDNNLAIVRTYVPFFFCSRWILCKLLGRWIQLIGNWQPSVYWRDFVKKCCFNINLLKCYCFEIIEQSSFFLNRVLNPRFWQLKSCCRNTILTYVAPDL
jgi:hypothetical protein